MPTIAVWASKSPPRGPNPIERCCSTCLVRCVFSPFFTKSREIDRASATFLCYTVLLATFAGLLLLSWLHSKFLKHRLMFLFHWLQHLGKVDGALVLCAANASIFLLPCLPFTLAAGFLFGTVQGTLLISLSSTTAAVLSFLLSRYMARGWIERAFSKKAAFRAMDHAINESGFRLVFLVRSSPLAPYGVSNYLFGLTSVSFMDYVVATFLGMLPVNMVEVYFGTAIKNVSDILRGEVASSRTNIAFFWLGLLVSFGVTLYVTLWMRAVLDKELARHDAQQALRAHAQAQSLEMDHVSCAEEDNTSKSEEEISSLLNGSLCEKGGHVPGHPGPAQTGNALPNEHNPLPRTTTYIRHPSSTPPKALLGSAEPAPAPHFWGDVCEADEEEDEGDGEEEEEDENSLGSDENVKLLSHHHNSSHNSSPSSTSTSLSSSSTASHSSEGKTITTSPSMNGKVKFTPRPFFFASLPSLSSFLGLEAATVQKSNSSLNGSNREHKNVCTPRPHPLHGPIKEK
eukprot:g79017.t1